MNSNMSGTDRAELTQSRELSAQIGGNPQLTEASTGNSSIKLEGVLWIKATGKWMADAMREDNLISLDLVEVKKRMRQKVELADRYCGASLETAIQLHFATCRIPSSPTSNYMKSDSVRRTPSKICRSLHVCPI